MKNSKITRRLMAIALSTAITVSYMPATMVAFADEEAAPVVTTQEVKEEVKEAPAKAEEKKEEPAPAEEKKEDPAPAESQSSTVTEEKKVEVTEENKENTVEPEAVTITAAEAVQEEEAEKPAVTLAKTISVKYNFYQKDGNGNDVIARTITRSVKTGGNTTSISAATANTYVKNSKITGDDNMVLEYTKSWKDGSGNAVSFPLSMSYEEAGKRTNDGKTVEVDLYAQYSSHPATVDVTISYTGIMSPQGAVAASSSTTSMGWGNGSSKTLKSLESATGVTAGNSMYTNFTYNGVKYKYTGEWKAVDSNGNSFTMNSGSKVSIKVGSGETSGTNYVVDKALTLTFSPVYEMTELPGLDLYYIDNVSTGSGSWANKDGNGIRSSFSSMTHKFTDPSVKSPGLSKHYEFLYWADDESGDQYKAGESVTIKAGESGVQTVTIHAWWQPSVTVRYNYNGESVETEKFEDIDINAKALKIDGIEYEGWFDAAGNKIEAGQEAELPEITSDKVERKVVDVYAKRPVTITAASATWTYNGEAHSDDTVSVTAGGLFEGDIIEAKVSGSVKSVSDGNVANRIDSVKIMRNGTDVTAYYDITTVDGVLNVKAAPAAATTAKTGAKTTAAAQTAQAAPAAQVTAEIEETAVPKAAIIEDEATPLAAGNWAVLNLIAAIAAALGAVIAIFRKKEDDDEQNDEADNRSRKMFAAKAAGLLTAIAAVITFFLTEDMTLTAVLADRYTLLMAAMLAVQAVSAALNKKAAEAEDEEDADAEAALN